MFAFALFPLVFYFAFLACLHFRKTPTLLNGSLDFTLLAWGLFGFVTMGPGRLIIPIDVFAFWGVFTWLFWVGFYFVAVVVLARQFRNRLIIYHCQRELVLPACFTLARQIDPTTEWSGHVLSLHGLGVQWAVTGDPFGGHLLFRPTNPALENPNQEMLEEKLTSLCQTLVMPKRKIRWFWTILAFGLLFLALGSLITDFSQIIQYDDYWGLLEDY